MKYTFKLALSLLAYFFILQNKSYAQTYAYNLPLDSIKVQVEESSDYLIQLNKRMVYLDSVLEPNDFFWIYYGSAYLEGYSPYSEGISGTSLNDLLKKKKYNEVVSICKKQIINNPGYTRPIYYLGVAYELMGDTFSAHGFYNRYYNLLSEPFYSGTGVSVDSAFVVRNINDEYSIIEELGFEVQQQALVFEDNKPFDVMTVYNPKDSTKKDLYFNISQPYLLGLNFSDTSKDSTKDKKDKKKKEKKEKKDRKKKRKHKE